MGCVWAKFWGEVVVFGMVMFPPRCCDFRRRAGEVQWRGVGKGDEARCVVVRAAKNVIRLFFSPSLKHPGTSIPVPVPCSRQHWVLPWTGLFALVY